jgi:hypothetical protein
LEDLATIIDGEFRFMTSINTQGKLTGHARRLVEKVGHHILSERDAA